MVAPAVENPSGDTANNLHGNGGIGVGGDVNKRGGRGGSTYYSSTKPRRRWRGSAPAPYGVSVGFVGGNGATYSGGGGGGIGNMPGKRENM